MMSSLSTQVKDRKEYQQLVDDIVEPAFTIDGQLQKGFTPLFFIQVGHQWKVSIKK